MDYTELINKLDILINTLSIFMTMYFMVTAMKMIDSIVRKINRANGGKDNE